MTEGFEVRSHDYVIKGVLTFPEGSGKFPCVVLSHGLISSKESAKYLVLAEALKELGIGSCRFDYHGCGESEGNIEETTLTMRIANLEAVVDFVSKHPLTDPQRLGLLGSSFGGCTSLVKAARDKRVVCVSLWAIPYVVQKDEKEKTIDGITFKDTLYEDFERYDLLAEAEKVSRALVIHGTNDNVVPVDEGKTIFQHLREPKKLELLEGADHTFTAPEDRERATSLALDWFRRFLL